MLNTQKKIETFVTKEFNQELKNYTILKEDHNTYLLFDKFKVYKNKNGFTVSYYRISESYFFCDIRNAITFCIFENFNNYVDANRMKDLDRILSDIDFSNNLQNKLIKKSKTKEQKLLHHIKLNEGLHRKKFAVEELEKLINISRTLLDKKFRVV